MDNLIYITSNDNTREGAISNNCHHHLTLGEAKGTGRKVFVAKLIEVHQREEPEYEVSKIY